MNCTQVRERLLAWHYGELSIPERAAVDKHLETCADCRERSLAWREFRRTLDAFNTPAVQVNLPRLYQQAVERHERHVGRWRRAAVAVMAAAAVALVAVGLKLEIRMETSQVVVHWGGPSQGLRQLPEPPPAPAMAQAQPPVPQVNPEDLQLVKDLIRVLAQDIQTRDRRQQEALLRLQAHFETLLGRANDRWAGNERDVAALYAAQFRLDKKGGIP
jgi:hypothetical protein